MTKRQDHLKRGGCIFAMRRDLAEGYLRFQEEGMLDISIPGCVGILSRKDARLLAKRINEALDFWSERK